MLISVSAILLNEFTVLVFLLFVASSTQYEFYKLFLKKEYQVLSISGIISGLFVFVGVYSAIKSSNEIWLLLCSAILLALPLVLLFSKREYSTKSVLLTFLGVIYIVIPSAMALHIAMPLGVHNGILLLAPMILIWIFDTMAYVSGTSLGKHKMAPKISPAKSWEGFAGGAIFTVLSAYLLSLYFKDIELQTWIAMAIIVVLFATPGDLLASYLKRKAGVKDSGNLIPGHGGILDRFDSFMLVMPVAWLYINTFV